jgi:ribosomal protein S6
MPRKKTDNLEGKKAYEVGFLLKDPISEKTVLDLLSQHKATVINKSPAKPIKLAYPIKKHVSAYFEYINFEADPSEVKSFSDSLKHNNEILRYLVVTVSGKKAEEKTEIKKSAKLETSSSNSMLSNEALEEKLEEILK